MNLEITDEGNRSLDKEFCDGSILVTGSDGFVGRNVISVLKNRGYSDVTGVDRSEADLRSKSEVRNLFEEIKPDVVINLAGVVGGILANKKRPAEFYYDNLLIGTHVMHESHRSGVNKYLACICGCAYPEEVESPIHESSLWDGYPHESSAPYSSAKKMTVVQAEAYRKQYDFNSVILCPGNLYGPHDNFHPEDAHVIPALIRRVYEAKREGRESLTVWGTGKPVRDFVYVEDVAKAIVHALETYDGDKVINISSGRGITIKNLVQTLVEVAGFDGSLEWDTDKPDGQMHKVFDVTRMKEILDFRCETTLEEGLRKTYEWFSNNYEAMENSRKLTAND